MSATKLSDLGDLDTRSKGWMDRMADEPLLPELEEYITIGGFGKMLSHPLIMDLAPNMLPGAINRRYLAKKEHLEKAIEEDDLDRIVFLHERPYRFDALEEYVLLKGGVIWDYSKKIQDLVIDVWVDSDNIYQYAPAWRRLFSDRPAGRVLGNANELRSFRKLPDEFPVWRGGGDSSFLTWTTHEDVAKRFAYVPSGDIGSLPRKVRTRMMRKEDCFAYFTRRGEYEVLSFEGEGA